MDYSIFRERLRQLVDSRGQSINVLSEALGMSTPTLSRYLSGNRTPDLPYVVKISEYFCVSVDWLIGLNGDKYEIMPQEIQDVAELYSIATQDDRRVIQAVLSKYRREGG